MSRKIKIKKDDGFNNVLAGILANGIGTFEEGGDKSLHQHLADHVVNSCDAMSDDELDDCLGQWFGIGDDDGDEPGETYTDPDLGDENQDDGPEMENTIEQRAN